MMVRGILGATAILLLWIAAVTAQQGPQGMLQARLSIDSRVGDGSGKSLPAAASVPSIANLRLVFYSGAVTPDELRRYADDPRSCSLPVCLMSTEEEIVSTAYRALKTQQGGELSEDDDRNWDRTIDVWNTSIAGVTALAGLSGSAIAYIIGRKQGAKSGTRRNSARAGTTPGSRSRARAALKNATAAKANDPTAG